MIEFHLNDPYLPDPSLTTLLGYLRVKL